MTKIINASWLKQLLFLLSFGKLGMLYQVKGTEPTFKWQTIPDIHLNCRCSVITEKDEDEDEDIVYGFCKWSCTECGAIISDISIVSMIGLSPKCPSCQTGFSLHVPSMVT